MMMKLTPEVVFLLEAAASHGNQRKSESIQSLRKQKTSKSFEEFV